LPDRWVLHRLNQVIEDCTRLFDGYQFGEAGRQAYDFLWGDFADWYIEACKPRLQASAVPSGDAARQTLVYVLDQTLRLLHPFIPFVTEELWQHLPHGEGESPALIVAAWPERQPAYDAPDAAASFERLTAAIGAIRNARSEYNVDPGRRIAAVIDSAGDGSDFQAQAAVLSTLARLDPDQLRFGAVPVGEPGVTLVVGETTVFLPLGGMIDLEAERERLRKQLAETEGRIQSAEGRLDNPGFVDKAPAHVVEQARQGLAELRTQRDRLGGQLAALG